MLENFRSQKIIWDRANKTIFEKIEANSGDSNGRKLVVQVINQGVTENLVGTTLSLGWKYGKSAKGLDAFDVVDASKGIFEIYYTTEMLSNIGNIEASLVLTDSTGRIESSIFTISVTPSTVDDESVESENSFTALTEALVKVSEWGGRIDAVEQDKAELSYVNNQLTQNQNYVDGQLMSKRDKGESIKLIDLDTDVKTAMTGGSVPVVGVDAVGQENLKDNSATSYKRTNLGDIGLYTKSATAKEPNLDTTNKTITFYGSFWITHKKKRYTFENDLIFNYITTSVNQYILFNTDTQTFRVIAANNENGHSENEILIMSIGIFNSSTIRDVFFTGTYTIDGRFHTRLNNEDVGTEKVKKQAITAEKRTSLGENGYLIISATAEMPNLELAARTLTIHPSAWVAHRNARYTVSTEKNIPFAPGTNQLLIFNTDSQEFYFRGSSQMVGLLQNDIVLGVFCFDSAFSEIKSHWATFDFYLNGEPFNSGIGLSDGNKNKTYYFTPEEISGFYKSTEGTYTKFTTAAEYNQALSVLSTDHSDYLVQTLEGKDSSGNYDVFSYRLKPEVVPDSEINKTLPKMILVGGLHGREQGSVFSLYYLIKDICENWRTNPLLEYLRWNVEIVCIPLANPWAFDYGNGSGRENFNGVDLNRDFGGVTPFSQTETRYVRDMLLNNKDAVYFGDYHTNGTSGTEYDTLMWHSNNGGGFYSEELQITSKYFIGKMTRELAKNYALPLDVGYFGYLSNSTVDGTCKTYAGSLGFNANTIESWKKFPTETSEYSPETIKASTEYIGNWLLTVLKRFKDVY